MTRFTTNSAGITRHRAASTHLRRYNLKSTAPSPMASPVADIGQSHQHHPVTESAADSASHEAQKWIEVSHREPAQNPSVLCFLLAQVFVVIACGLSYWFAACLCSAVSFKELLDFIASSPVERWIKRWLHSRFMKFLSYIPVHFRFGCCSVSQK